MALGKEVVEFGQTGLKELKEGVKDLKKEMTKAHTANEKLKKDMASGAYGRAVKQYQSAQKALSLFRKDQEAISRNFRRDQLNQRYGRLGGAMMMYGGGALRSARGVAGRIGSGILGGAAALGAPVALGAMASRGFSGTAAAAKLDMEFTRLSRSVATDLLPAISAISTVMRRVSNAREAVRSGRGSLGDKATTYGFYGALAGSAFLGGNFLTGGGLGRGITGAAGSAWRGAGAAATGASRFAGPIGLAYLAYQTQDTLRNYNAYENKYDQPFERAALQQQRKAGDKRNWFQRNFPNVSYAFGRSGGGPPGEVAGDAEADRRFKEKDRRSRAQRNRDRIADVLDYTPMLAFSQGASALGMDTRGERNALRAATAPGGETRMRLVQGAGERRSSSDLYEELAAGFAQTGIEAKGQESGNGPLGILGDILDVGRQILGKLGG